MMRAQEVRLLRQTCQHWRRKPDLRPRQAWNGQPEGTRGPRRRHQRSLLGRRLSRVGTTAWVANHTKGRRRVLVAAIIAGMFVLMEIISDIDDGLHDLDETGEQ
jgi:hypothetical protein